MQTTAAPHPPPPGIRRRRPQPHLLNLAPQWLTRQQAAAIAGTTTRTIDRWRTEGTLTTYRRRDGRAYRPVLVARDDLRALLAVGAAPVEP